MHGSAVALVCSALIAASGCAAGDEGGGPDAFGGVDGDGVRVGLRSRMGTRLGAGFGAESAIVGRGAVGLETQWWIAPDADRAVAKALAGAAIEDGRIAEAESLGWREDGLRVVIVRAESLRSVVESAPPVRDWRRRWLGEETRWSAVIAGRELDGERRVLLGDRAERVGRGTPRLLARGWVQPAFPGVASLRVEAAWQLQRAEEPPTFAVEVPRELASEADLGPLLDGLALTVGLRRGEALVIVPAPPGEDWAAYAGSAEASESGVEPDADGGEDDEPMTVERLDALLGRLESGSGGEGAFGGDAIGPSADVPRTLGETALTFEDASGRPLTAVIVLLARVPEEYRLLGVRGGADLGSGNGATGDQ